MGSSVVVCDEGALDGCADLPVVPDGGVEREQPLDDPGPQPGGDPAAVALEAELVFQRPDDRLDPVPQPVREGPGFLLVLAGRPDQGQAQVRAGEERLGVLAGLVVLASGTSAWSGGRLPLGWSATVLWGSSPQLPITLLGRRSQPGAS